MRNSVSPIFMLCVCVGTIRAQIYSRCFLFLGDSFVSGRERHININKVPGLSRVWVGAKNLLMCFLGVIPDGGE